MAFERQVLVDSNLLLLLVIGRWNPSAIAGFKRLTGLTFGDFDLLRNFLQQFNKIVTTAHILTEVSNLAGAATGETRQAIFSQFALSIQTLEERVIASASLCQRSEFRAFGLTDSALSNLCLHMTLITQDARLAAHLQRQGLKALSLEHIRVLRSLSNHG